MDTSKPTAHISLCAGYGGIDLGLHRAISNLRTVAYFEIEAFAVANLVAKMEAGLLDPAPIWPDIKTFPNEEFHGLVDILVAGYPCQPFSAAGKRKGEEDPRHLWPHIRRAIGIIRPRMCFFENVEGHISLGLSTVISDLEEDGYRTTWGIFSASEVGAPHQRKRVFILAYCEQQGLEGLSRHVADGNQPGRNNEDESGSTGEGGICGGWKRVSFSGDCIGGDAEELGDECSICGEDYAECDCPGPTQDGYEYREIDGILYAREIDGQNDGDTNTNGGIGTAWPSRPGEPQHAWEPPRVVANSNRVMRGPSPIGRQHDPEAGSTGQTVVDPLRQNAGIGQQLCPEECRPGGTLPSESEYAGEGDAMGNAAESGFPITGGQRTTLGEPGTEPQPQRPDESGRGLADNQQRNGQRRAERNGGRIGELEQDAEAPTRIGGEGNVFRQVESAMGGNPHGPASGMDYAELCVSTDNRTDELRLLGNGVVPATAERAFRILLERLIP